MNPSEELSRRRLDTESRINDLRNQLQAAAVTVQGKASVYATGSFGRGEANDQSDLDLFIVGRRVEGEAGLKRSEERFLLSRLEEICVKADLIRATQKLEIPKFDGDGKYLVQFSVEKLTETLGTPDDDSTNTFTARLLLLLESRSLLNEEFYAESVRSVMQAYWRDYEGHEKEFIPAYLTNDILRLWRTFCVNYEARTENWPESKRIERKLKNYKLKYSRILTCYSSIMYMLAVFQLRRTVSIDEAVNMTTLSPIDRIKKVLEFDIDKKNSGKIDEIIERYGEFLMETNVAKDVLFDKFMDVKTADKLAGRGREFGDAMHSALASIAPDSKFYRILVV